jgi:hypothetical protein
LTTRQPPAPTPLRPLAAVAAAALEPVLAADPGVAAAWLRGSILHREAPRDLDLAVLCREGIAPWQVFARLRPRLAAALDATGQAMPALDVRPVDERAPPMLRFALARSGRLLCERDRAARVAFQADAARDGLDFAWGLARAEATRRAGAAVARAGDAGVE